jgi:hypothetical protein
VFTEAPAPAAHDNVYGGEPLLWTTPSARRHEPNQHNPKKPKFFKNFSPHQILRHIHEILNIDENKK